MPKQNNNKRPTRKPTALQQKNNSSKVSSSSLTENDDTRIRCPSCWELYESPAKLASVKSRQVTETETEAGDFRACRRCHRVFSSDDAELWKLAVTGQGA